MNQAINPNKTHFTMEKQLPNQADNSTVAAQHLMMAMADVEDALPPSQLHPLVSLFGSVDFYTRTVRHSARRLEQRWEIASLARAS